MRPLVMRLTLDQPKSFAIRSDRESDRLGMFAWIAARRVFTVLLYPQPTGTKSALTEELRDAIARWAGSRQAPRSPLGCVARHPLDPPDLNTDTMERKTKLRSAQQRSIAPAGGPCQDGETEARNDRARILLACVTAHIITRANHYWSPGRNQELPHKSDGEPTANDHAPARQLFPHVVTGPKATYSF
jgi:hypothetical protein